jgi:hypothetical protein
MQVDAEMHAHRSRRKKADLPDRTQNPALTVPATVQHALSEAMKLEKVWEKHNWY